MKRILLIFCFLIVTTFTPLIAQVNQSLLMFNELPLNNSFHPELVYNAKWTVGFPVISGTYVDFYSPITLNNFGSIENGKLNIDFDQIIKKFPTNANFYQSLTVPLLNFSFGKKDQLFTFSMAEKENLTIQTNKDLFQLIAHGNAPYLDYNILHPKLGLNFINYHELAVGYSSNVNRNFSWGIKIKFLLGSFSVESTSSEISIQTTSDMSSINLGIDGNYQIAGVPLSIASPTQKLIDTRILNSGDWIQSLLSTQNKGIALDLGMKFKLDRFSDFSISLIDFGRINWQQNVQNVNIDGSYVWKGINLSEVTDVLSKPERNIASYLNSISDTLKNSYTLTTNNNRFQTNTPARLLLQYQLKLSPMFTFGAINNAVFTQNTFRNAFTLAGNFQLNQFVAVNTSYSIIGNSFLNIGSAIYAKLNGIDLFIASDNLLWFIDSSNFKGTNVNFGCNIRIEEKVKGFNFKTTTKRSKSKSYNVVAKRKKTKKMKLNSWYYPRWR